MISIIVPVYNAEKYLENTLNSVYSQSYKDWELILIDDGSDDSSPEICDKAALSPKVKIIHKPNGGLSSSRNAGLKIANGDFIYFLDADDIIPPDSLLSLITAYKNKEADIICGKILKFKNSYFPKITKSYNPIKLREYTPYEAVKMVLYQNNLDNSVCGKLFASHLWKDLKFKEKTYYEDLDIFYKLFFKANRIITIENIVYLYRQHDLSYIHTFNIERKDMLAVTESIVGYMKTEYPSLVSAAQSRQLSANFNMLMLISANYNHLNPEEKNKAKIISDECWKKIKQLRFKSLADRSVRIKNKAGILLSYLGGRNILNLTAGFFY